MKRADVIGRRLLYVALLAASAVLLLLMVIDSFQDTQRDVYIASAPEVQTTPLPAMHEWWLLNSGDVTALDELPGIGPVTAQRIIENRETDGLFYFPEDIMEVKGIGEKTMRSILQWLKENPEKAYIVPE